MPPTRKVCAELWDPKSGRRKCGTALCRFYDYHDGPHSHEMLEDAGKRPRTQQSQPAEKKKKSQFFFIF